MELTPLVKILFIYLCAINVLTFVAYGLDKHKARKGKWRTPESTLLLLDFIGGAAGAWCGMQTFRHKTKHWKFKILVPLFLLMWIAALGWIAQNYCGIQLY
mgnify:CR=1 FL=1